MFFNRYLFSPRAGSVVKTVSRICILGVAIGVSAFIIIMSIMNGFNNSTKKRYLKVEPHIVVQPAANFKLTQLNSPLVSSVSPFEVQDIFIRTSDNFSGAIAKGLPKNELLNIFSNFHDQTEFDSAVDDFKIISLVEAIENIKPGEVLIGLDLARSAGLFEGDRINILPPETLLLPAGDVPLVEQVTVKGIFTTNISEIDSKYIYYVIGESLTSFNQTASRSEGYEVRLLEPEKYDKYLSQVNPKATLETWVQRNASLFLALKVERWMMTIFLSLSGLITSFTVVTVLILLITQRKNDIGVLMTLGLSHNALKSIFTKVGLILFSIGFVGGLIIGVGVSLLLSVYPLEILPDIYYERTIPSKLDYHLVLGMSIVAIILGVFTAWLPAQKISSMDPIEILRKN